MISRKIRVAVVGTGEFGRNHVRVYGEMAGVELVAVVDQNLERAEKTAQEFRTKAFKGIEELRGKVDAVTVAVPTIVHAEVGCRLMEIGIDVLVEKANGQHNDRSGRASEIGEKEQMHFTGRTRGAVQPGGSGSGADSKATAVFRSTSPGGIHSA